MSSNLCIGIAGGSGSGKTTFALRLCEHLGSELSHLIYQDSYYRDPSHLSPAARAEMNYDHPEAFETELLIAHLDRLKMGKPIPRLGYDYVNHRRVEHDEEIAAKRVVIVEGILALENSEMRDRFDLKIFVDTASDLRVLRRMKRDLNERGRTVELVEAQYLTTVRPMHRQFVEPSKQHADIIILGTGENDAALGLVLSRVHDHISRISP